MCLDFALDTIELLQGFFLKREQMLSYLIRYVMSLVNVQILEKRINLSGIGLLMPPSSCRWQQREQHTLSCLALDLPNLYGVSKLSTRTKINGNCGRRCPRAKVCHALHLLHGLLLPSTVTNLFS